MSDTPFGLQITQNLDGSYKGGTMRMSIPASDGTAVGPGFPVKLNGASDADGTLQCIAAAAGDALCGVIASVEPDPDYLDKTHRVASTQRYVLVYVDPDATFVAQEDADGGALAAANMGQNANLVFGGLNTTTGVANVEIDSSSAATTATLQVKLLGLAKGYDDDTAFSSTGAKFLVKINNHQFGSHTGTAGV